MEDLDERYQMVSDFEQLFEMLLTEDDAIKQIALVQALRDRIKAIKTAIELRMKYEYGIVPTEHNHYGDKEKDNKSTKKGGR